MLTVAELQAERQAKARVNHETYKLLLGEVQQRLRARAANRGRDLLWQVPPLVPGRPVFAPGHAARYVGDKLRRGGFDVVSASPRPDVHLLYISWAPVPKPARADSEPAPRATGESSAPRATGESSAPGATGELVDAARTLERLKARLRVG